MEILRFSVVNSIVVEQAGKGLEKICLLIKNPIVYIKLVKKIKDLIIVQLRYFLIKN